MTKIYLKEDGEAAVQSERAARIRELNDAYVKRPTASGRCSPTASLS